MLDLQFEKNTHERFGSSSDPSINGHLHYPNDVDRSLMRLPLTRLENIALTIITTPPNAISFMSAIGSTSGRIHNESVRLLFLQAHRETDRFFEASGVHLPTHDRDQFHYRHTTFSYHLESKIVNILTKTTALRITLNIDVAPLSSRSHTHPSHSQTSRLLTSSLSLGVPVKSSI